jgi:hydrogenase nickel incorporation protein HypB
MKVKVGKKILISNEEYAEKNKAIFGKNKILCLNMISSPGSGKTAILTRTINELKGRIKIGVVEGDIETDFDAKRIRRTGAPAVQINTEGACHLSAAQVNGAIKKLPIGKLDLIFIENVGNLICPAAFELGEAGKIAVLSVAEGDDKPAKYPAIFAQAKVLLINKADLLDAGAAVDFDVERVIKAVGRLNRRIAIFVVSAKTGDGFSNWCKWLIEQASGLKEEGK